MAEFPAHLFRMEGDPSAIRSSAGKWHGFGAAATQAASEITGLDTSQFVGPEGDQFRKGLNASMPGNLRVTGDAFGRVATSLRTFADALSGLQDEMRPLAQRAPGLWAALQAARGRAERARDADARHEREVAARPPEDTEPDTYRSDSGAAGADLSQAQREWDACVAAANGLRTRQTTAVRDCVRVINEAKDLRFRENPKWWNLKGQFTNFVRDNQELLQKLSGALKIVSLVAGLLSFIPVLAPVMGPIAIAAGATALLIDASVYAATGKGSLTQILIDGVLTVVPIGRLAMLGRNLPRVAQAFSSVANRGRNMSSVARWGLANPRANGIEATKRLARLDPIDIACGDMVLTQTDVELPGALPLVLSRTHLSSYRMGSWFGRSWASTLDMRMEADETGVYVTSDDGMTLIYPVSEGGGPARLPLEGPRWPLEPGTEVGGYAVSDPWRGWRWHFRPVPADPTGQLPLVALTDRNGHRVDIVRDAQGAPVELVHSGGYRVLVRTEQNRVVGLALADGSDATELIRFAYNASGDLTEVVNSSGLPLRFDYDDEGRIVRWADRNGTEYRYVYDGAGRCVATSGTGGHLDGRLHYDPDAGTTTVVDSFGNATVYHLNELRQTERITDPSGGTTTFAWDRYDRKIEETDALGRSVRYGYDDAGNLVEVVRPDESRAVASYNALHQPLVVTDFDGATWRRAYDERGNLTMVSDPTGAVTRYRYDDAGHLTEVVDALGNALRTETDVAGLVRRTTDSTGAVTSYQRDNAGRITGVTDPVGGTTYLGWTVDGQLAWRRTPDGAHEEWTYDAEGNLVTHTDPTGATTEFEIGAFDLPVSRTGPDGSRLTFAYDTELRLTTVTNPQGLTWRYEYDPAGRLIAETDFNGRTQAYTHDAAGQLVGRANGAGQQIDLVRDELGHVVEKRTAEGVTTFRYDPVGRLLHAASPDVDLRFERDALGRVLAEIRDGQRLTAAYDALGRRTHRRTPSGLESTWEYGVGRRPVALSTGGQTVRFTHDAAGRETRRSVGALVLTQTWDPNHRLLSQALTANGAGGSDALAGVPELVAHRAYRYRVDGYLVGVADQVTGERRLELDRAGRITAVRAADWTERYAYDEAGNVASAIWPDTGEDGAARGDREYTGTLIRRAGDVRYEHDPAGRVVLRQRKERSTKPSTWRYTWDSDDRLVGVTTPDGTRWRYRYDALGRRVAKQRLDADGAVAEQVDFTWDGPRLVEQTHRDGTGERTSTWEYAPGTFTPISQTDGSALDQDEVDRRFYAIVADLTGAPTELVGPDGRVAWQQRTTVWGVPTHVSVDEADCPLRYPGQIKDPETGACYNYHRYYDPDTGRYASPDPLGLLPSPSPHSYVANPLFELDPLGLTPYPHDPSGNGSALPLGGHSSGTARPPWVGGVPNSVYTRVGGDGTPVQNTIYNDAGDAVGHFDFKHHNTGGPHGHVIDPPGTPGGGHGAGAPHIHQDKLPPAWKLRP
ncbi:DUF6531 domain-containing protein [Micromonospora echinospora]|uniref:DUF6531 domain-containing protein n=1 Tax=Micromonospora echinospora TaxID=1877 RepID=UPI0037B0115B